MAAVLCFALIVIAKPLIKYRNQYNEYWVAGDGVCDLTLNNIGSNSSVPSRWAVVVCAREQQAMTTANGGINSIVNCG